MLISKTPITSVSNNVVADILRRLYTKGVIVSDQTVAHGVIDTLRTVVQFDSSLTGIMMDDTTVLIYRHPNQLQTANLNRLVVKDKVDAASGVDLGPVLESEYPTLEDDMEDEEEEAFALKKKARATARKTPDYEADDEVDDEDEDEDSACAAHSKYVSRARKALTAAPRKTTARKTRKTN